MDHNTTLCDETPSPSMVDYTSTVDTSRPFSSVKEAVAIFDERLLAGHLFSHKPIHNNTTPNHHAVVSWSPSPSPQKKLQNSCSSTSSGNNSSNSSSFVVVETLKKLEADLKETKGELRLLKERESETEVALATLNAELHKNMSRMAKAEAAAAAKAVAVFEEGDEERMMDRLEEKYKLSPSLAEVLLVGHDNNNMERGGENWNRKNSKKKKKPIIPLVGDLFSRKKKGGSSRSIHNSLFSSSPQAYFN